MRRMTRRAALAALAAGAAVVLAGCAAAGPTPGATFSARASGPLTGWGFNNADDVGKARLAAAAEALPGVDTTLDQTTFDAVKFVTRIASNTVPDVVQMDTASVDTYAAQGLIVPLDACFAAHDVDPAERWYPQIVSTIRYRDHVWAVPQFYQPPAIVLNHRVLQAAGADAADFDTSDREALVATAKRLTVFRGSSPVRLGFDPQGSGNLQLWLLGGGGTIVDARGRPRLDTAANARTLEFLKRLYDAQGGYARVKSLVDSFDQFGERNQFARDQVAAEVQPQWYVNVLAPYRDALDVRATPFRDAEGDPYTTAGSTAFVIPAGAKHLDAACAWALALTDPSAWEAAGAARARTVAQDDDGINTGLFTGSPAADRAVRERYVKDTGDRGFDQVIGTYYGILDDGGSPGATPAGAPIGQALTNAFTSVVLGEQSAASALAAAQTKAELAYRRATANE